MIPVIPVIVFCPDLLNIWLGEVPNHAVGFSRLILVGIIFRSLHEPLNMYYMTLGRIKRMMVIEMTVMLSFLLFVFISLSAGYPMRVAFAELTLMESVIIIALLFNAKIETKVNISKYIKQVLMTMITLLLIAMFIYIFVSKAIPEAKGLISILYTAVLAAIQAMIVYFFLSKDEINIIKNIIKKH